MLHNQFRVVSDATIFQGHFERWSTLCVSYRLWNTRLARVVTVVCGGGRMKSVACLASCTGEVDDARV